MFSNPLVYINEWCANRSLGSVSFGMLTSTAFQGGVPAEADLSPTIDRDLDLSIQILLPYQVNDC